MNPVYEAQLLTLLRLTGVRLDFLINFTFPHIKDGIKRMVFYKLIVILIVLCV